MQLCPVLIVLILPSKPAVKLQNGGESHVLHPLYLPLLYDALFFFFLSICFFYLIFVFLPLASTFCFPSPTKAWPYFTTCFTDLLWKSVHIHPSEKLQRTSQKGVQWGIQLLSSPRKTNSSALWNWLSSLFRSQELWILFVNISTLQRNVI